MPEGSRRILMPSVVAAFLPFVLLWLPPDHWNPEPLIGAGALMLLIGVVALNSSWEGPRWRVAALAYGYLIVIALLRAAGGASGVSAMMLLPVCWVALYGTRRELWYLLFGVAMLCLLPLIVVGGHHYPSSAWRIGILFVTLSGIVGTTVQSLVIRSRAHELERDQLLARLDGLAHTDELTSLPNRRAWQSELDRSLARARRSGEQLSVAVIDIDSFKAVNDEHGHPAGDALLVEAARGWSEVLRPEDMLARVGGDEFALLMLGCPQAEADMVVERLHGGMPGPYSCSIGLATWDGTELADGLMYRADSALYEIKRMRRGLPPTSSNDIGDAGQHAHLMALTLN